MDLSLNSQGKLSLLFALYSLTAGVVWVARLGWTSMSLGALGLHLMLTGGLIFRARHAGSSDQYQCPGSTRTAAAMLWPWLLWLLAWTEIGWLFRAATPLYHDQAIAQLGLAVFGVHWNELLPRLWSGRGWQEAMTGFYLSYYFLIVGPAVILAVQRRRQAFMDHTLGLMLTYLGCFAIYLLLPVTGPREMALAVGSSTAHETVGFLPRLMNAVFAAGDSVGTAFPSSHCAGATAAALLCQRHFSGRVAVLCGIWAGLIVISTIHTNNHYAIDGLAGVGLAGLFCFKGVRHETHTGHGRDRLYRPAPRHATHPAGARAPASGAQPGQGVAPVPHQAGLHPR